LHFRSDQRLTDGHHAAFGHAHEEPRTEQREERSRDTRQKTAQRKGERRRDEQSLAAARTVGDVTDAERGECPREGQRSRENAHLLVVETELRLHERLQEIERVPIEEHDTEIETEEAYQYHLIGRARLAERPVGRAHFAQLAHAVPPATSSRTNARDTAGQH